MVGIAEIGAGLGSLKAIKDIVQGLNAANFQASINDVKIELQGHILDANQALFAAQEAQTTATQRIAALEQEIMHLKDWEAEKQRYELKNTGQGSLAFMLKEGMEAGEPAHWICPHCYEERKKSILKHEILPVGRTETLVCHRCGFDVVTRGVRHEQPKIASGRKSPPYPRR